MSRAFPITILTGVFLAMPAIVPDTVTSLSGSALAQKVPTTDATNLNTSRSNRMGGGPGKGTANPATGSANKTNLNTSRSNNY